MGGNYKHNSIVKVYFGEMGKFTPTVNTMNCHEQSSSKGM